MADDYFDDASDADFLALAQQIETRDQRTSVGVSRGGSSGGGNAQPRPPVSQSPVTSKPAIPSKDARSETSSSNDKTPRVLRPGFNAIIVNTRQVTTSPKYQLIHRKVIRCLNVTDRQEIQSWKISKTSHGR